MSEQASYEYGRSPNHTDYDRARVDKYMSVCLAAIITSHTGHPQNDFYNMDEDWEDLLESCADLVVSAIKAVDKKIYETTP